MQVSLKKVGAGEKGERWEENGTELRSKHGSWVHWDREVRGKRRILFERLKEEQFFWELGQKPSAMRNGPGPARREDHGKAGVKRGRGTELNRGNNKDSPNGATLRKSLSKRVPLGRVKRGTNPDT